MKIKEIFKKKNLHRRDKYYFIAEVGVNHEGSMSLAKRLIREAKNAGANAVKFQTYKAKYIASKYAKAYWDTKKEKCKNQYELFKKYDQFNEKEYAELKKYCTKIKIDFMSTPFDLESAKFLNKYVSCFKISSSDITNYPLLKLISSFKKPVILSTGASNLKEITSAVKIFKNNELVLLHCILNYPTKRKNINMGMMLDLKKKFPTRIIGYSDHSEAKEKDVLELAVLLGAKVIEKHFTFNKKLPGNDHYHAYDQKDLKNFKNNLKKKFEIIGSYKKDFIKTEIISRKNARRSLYISKNINKGQKLTSDKLISLRPAIGISPMMYKKVLGKRLIKNMSKGDLIKPSNLK
tara:strand:- start:2300 stop:3346 length:1047 start_codon:yes stop_codon:yes gene_type:complete